MKPKTFNLIKWLFFPFFFFWCFLQNLIGLCVLIFLKCKKEGKRLKSEDEIVYFSSKNFSVSLGYFIFAREGSLLTIHHEWGHQIQSLILGFLYLFIIGIPSGLNCCLDLDKGNIYKYYNHFWESWADKLGKIKHENFSYNRSLKS